MISRETMTGEPVLNEWTAVCVSFLGVLDFNLTEEGVPW